MQAKNLGVSFKLQKCTVFIDLKLKSALPIWGDNLKTQTQEVQIMSQVHKRFTSDQVKELLDRYLKNEIERKYIQEILGIKRRRFFTLVKQYRENPQRFTIQYQRTSPPRISQDIEQNMLQELSIDKEIIQDKDIPLKSYNYSYIKDRLKKKHHQKVSLTTIIDRAKNMASISRNPKGASMTEKS